jgi:septum formation protein
MNADRKSHDTPLVLASGSVYRKALLERLGLKFTVDVSDAPEDRLPDEEPGQLVTRLAMAKARVVAPRHAGAIVIGADQIAVREGEILGKPVDMDDAAAQLAGHSGRAIEFLTGVCVLDGRSPESEPFLHVGITRVEFQPLGPKKIRRYLARERPLDCTGSFKAEGLGIALFERIDSRDPTGLIGLPLIWLAGVLRHLGYLVP